MPSKNKVSLTARVTEDDAKKFESIATLANISSSALMKLLVDGVLSGDIEVEKGEIKLGVDPIGYAVCDDLDTPFGQKVDRKFDRLRERGYPENFIYSMKEQILNGIDSQIDMLPKKFDARRMRDSDIGC